MISLCLGKKEPRSELRRRFPSSKIPFSIRSPEICARAPGFHSSPSNNETLKPERFARDTKCSNAYWNVHLKMNNEVTIVPSHWRAPNVHPMGPLLQVCLMKVREELLFRSRFRHTPRCSIRVPRFAHSALRWNIAPLRVISQKKCSLMNGFVRTILARSVRGVWTSRGVFVPSERSKRMILIDMRIHCSMMSPPLYVVVFLFVLLMTERPTDRPRKRSASRFLMRKGNRRRKGRP